MKQVNYILTLFLIIASNQFCKAQSIDDEWVNGRVFLNNGDTLSGYIVFEDTYNIVQYTDEQKERIRTYSAFVLKGFELSYEKYSKTYTRFYWDKGYDNVQNTPDFFEILYDGKLKVLSKDKKITIIEAAPMPTYGYGMYDPYRLASRPIYTEKIVRTIYLAYGENKVYGLFKPKKDLLYLFPDREKELENHFKNNYIAPDDFLKIIKVVQLLEGT